MYELVILYKLKRSSAQVCF